VKKTVGGAVRKGKIQVAKAKRAVVSTKKKLLKRK